jgi:hypothetical protein
LTGTATFGFIFGGTRVIYDDTKEGGCTTTDHADEPGEKKRKQRNRRQRFTHFLKKENRISTNELSKVKQSNK